MVCGSCIDATRDLLRSLGVPAEGTAWRRAYGALHRRHDYGLSQGRRWAREEAKTHG